VAAAAGACGAAGDPAQAEPDRPGRRLTVRKAERLLNLVAMLLETPRPVTAQQIRETIPGYDQDSWETFKRMFERDKDELREMGIPVELAPTDQWAAEEGYR